MAKARQLTRQKNWAGLVQSLSTVPDVLQNSELSSMLIRAHAESGNGKLALTAFEDIIKHPKASYTSGSYSALAIVHANDLARLKDLYNKMKARVNKAYHTVDSYRDFFHLFQQLNDKDTANAVLDDLLKLGLVKDATAAEELLPEGGGGSDKALLDSLLAFFKGSNAARIQTAASYAVSVVIRQLVRDKELSKAEAMYSQVMQNKLTPDRETFEMLIEAYLAADQLSKAEKLYDDMNKGEVAPSKEIYHKLMRYYLNKQKDLKKAMEIYQAGRLVPVSFELSDYLQLLEQNYVAAPGRNPAECSEVSFSILDEIFKQTAGSFKYKMRWSISTFFVETQILRGTFAAPAVVSAAKKWIKAPLSIQAVAAAAKYGAQIAAEKSKAQSKDKKQMTDKAKEKVSSRIMEKKLEEADTMSDEEAIEFAQNVNKWKEAWRKAPAAFSPSITTPYIIPPKPVLPQPAPSAEKAEPAAEKPKATRGMKAEAPAAAEAKPAPKRAPKAK